MISAEIYDMIAELEAKPQFQRKETGKIVFFGSSSFRLWETVQKDLNQPDIINLGYGGSTLEACDHFFERLILPFAPRALVMYAGDNDIGQGRDPEAVKDSFMNTVRKTREHFPKIPIGYLSIKPSPERAHFLDRIVMTNNLVRGEIKNMKDIWYINVYHEMITAFGTVRDDLFIEDRLHMNVKGYRIWQNRLEQFRNYLLK